MEVMVEYEIIVVYIFADIQTIDMESPEGQSRLAHLSDEKYTVYWDKNTAAYNLVRRMVAEQNPDYIILMGDNIFSLFDFFDTLKNHRELMEIMDSFKIPWSVVFGNHDGDCPEFENSPNPITLEKVINIYKESEYFLYEKEENAEQGDYVVSLVEKGTHKLLKQFVIMNTHYCACSITDSQRAWYSEKMAKLVSGNTVIPSFMFVHIPFPEIYDEMLQKYGDSVVETEDRKFSKLVIPENENGDFGECNSYLYSPNLGMHFLIKKYGSTQSVYFAHCHENNMSVSYDGIRYTHVIKAGYYDQEIAHRHLNGATVITIGGNGYSYSLYHHYDSGKTEGGEYAVTHTKESFDENYFTFNHTTSLGVVAGSKKIILADGQSASISFDVVDSMMSMSYNDNIQTGFFVSPEAFGSNPWMNTVADYLNFMKIGPCPTNEDGRVMTSGIIQPTYKVGSQSIDKGYQGFSAEEVFKRYKTIKFTVYNNSGVYTYDMQIKNTGETADKYQVFRSGIITKDISGGFYLAYTCNRDIKLSNFNIDGSEFITDYICINVSLELNGIDSYAYTAVDADKGIFVYSSESRAFSGENDYREFETTIIAPQSGISAAKHCGFVITSVPTHAYPYNIENGGFMIAAHQGAMFTAGGSGVTATRVQHDNSYLGSGSANWPGTVFFKSYYSYKFRVYGDGKYEIYLKSILDKDAEYELVIDGVIDGLDMTKTYYVGLRFWNYSKLADTNVDGGNQVSINNATVS